MYSKTEYNSITTIQYNSITTLEYKQCNGSRRFISVGLVIIQYNKECNVTIIGKRWLHLENNIKLIERYNNTIVFSAVRQICHSSFKQYWLTSLTIMGIM